MKWEVNDDEDQGKKIWSNSIILSSQLHVCFYISLSSSLLYPDMK